MILFSSYILFCVITYLPSEIILKRTTSNFDIGVSTSHHGTGETLHGFVSNFGTVMNVLTSSISVL